MKPQFSTCWMLHWTPHIRSSFIYISWRHDFTDNTTTGVIVVKDGKNSSTYSRICHRQEEAPPSGTMGGCPFSTFWGLQQKEGHDDRNQGKTGKSTHWLQRERGEPLLMSCGLWAPQECFQPTCEVQWQDACRLGSSQGMYNMVCTPVRNVQYPWRGHGNWIMLLKGHRDVCIPFKSRGCWIIYALQAQFLRCWCSGLTYASDGVVPVINFWNKI